MKVTSYAVARPAYYDRDSTGTSLTATTSAGPHAATARWTFTVGSGKKSYVETVLVRLTGQTAPATAGIQAVGIDSFTSGVYCSILYMEQTSSAALPKLINQFACMVTLFPADQLVGYSSDLSIGGTAQYIQMSKVTTFTA